MESYSMPYPVLLSDGDQKYEKGYARVHALLTYKRFQAIIAQLTGLPPNQQSTFFVCKRIVKMTEKRQKLPINDNTDFSIILNQHNPSREKDCYFLVSVRKPKRDRKGRGRHNNTETDLPEDYDESGSSRGEISPSDERSGFDDPAVRPVKPKGGAGGFRAKPEKTILRRDSRTRYQAAARHAAVIGGGENSGFVAEDDWRRRDNNRWLQQETGYYNSAGGNLPAYYSHLYGNNDYSPVVSPVYQEDLNFWDLQAYNLMSRSYANQMQGIFQGEPRQGHMAVSGGGYFNSISKVCLVCEQCRLSRERPVPFHCCVYDERTDGFREPVSGKPLPSPAGPIERPVKAAA